MTAKYVVMRPGDGRIQYASKCTQGADRYAVTVWSDRVYARRFSYHVAVAVARRNKGNVIRDLS